MLKRLYLNIAPLTATREALEGWAPNNCRTEGDYKKSLYLFLHAYFNDPHIPIRKEYQVGASKVDININNQVLVEIKKDLHKKAEYDRLRGQIDDYLSSDLEIIILLIGKTEPQLRKELIRHARERSSSLITGSHIYIIEK
jgi:hypothetical protein